MPDVNANYDESKVGNYTLPDPLLLRNGKKVATAFEWMNLRRPELLDLFHQKMFGGIPPMPKIFRVEQLTEKHNALNGKALRREYRLHFSDGQKEHTSLMLVYQPEHAEGKVPVFIGLNFKGNPSQTPEKDVLHSDHHFEEEMQDHRWQFEEVVSRGYATCTLCYHDLFLDSHSDWMNSYSSSVLSVLCPGMSAGDLHKKYTAIGTWAWGLSRMLDACSLIDGIDVSRAAVHGHSRLGKTSLLAGANDPRFAFVISNCSGCCGASLSRRNFGENITFITRTFPHWFVPGFENYADHENELPFDQHEFLSLIAPRPLAVHSASEDMWADQRGEFLSLIAAEKVYALFGAEGLGTHEYPQPGIPVTGDALGYLLRIGKHDQRLEDWQHYLDMADRFLK